jgi:tetratricopeptide (TPR) repeat protein
MAFCGWLWRYNFGDKADGEQEVNGKSRNVCLYLSLAAVAMGTIFFYPAVIKPVKANLFAGNAYRYSQADPQKSINYYDKIFAVKTFGMREICMHLIRYATIAINAPEASEEIKKLIFTKAEEKSLEYLKVSKANSLQVRVGLAQLYLLYGEKNIFYYDKAIEILVDNIGDSPGRVEIYYIIASAYNEKGEIDNALEYLEKAYSVGKGVKSVYTNLMNLYAKKGEADKTSRIIENYLKQFNDLSAEEYRLAAEYYFKVDRTEEAKKVLIDYAIPAEPNSWRVYVSYASILENEGKISEAIEYLENRATEYPESADVFNQYVEYLNSIKK